MGGETGNKTKNTKNVNIEYRQSKFWKTDLWVISTSFLEFPYPH